MHASSTGLTIVTIPTMFHYIQLPFADLMIHFFKLKYKMLRMYLLKLILIMINPLQLIILSVYRDGRSSQLHFAVNVCQSGTTISVRHHIIIQFFNPAMFKPAFDHIGADFLLSVSCSAIVCCMISVLPKHLLQVDMSSVHSPPKIRYIAYER